MSLRTSAHTGVAIRPFVSANQSADWCGNLLLLVGPGALLPGPYLIVTGVKEVKESPGAINESAKPVDPGQTYTQAHACHQDHHAGTSVASCTRERSLS